MCTPPFLSNIKVSKHKRHIPLLLLSLNFLIFRFKDIHGDPQDPLRFTSHMLTDPIQPWGRKSKTLLRFGERFT